MSAPRRKPARTRTRLPPGNQRRWFRTLALSIVILLLAFYGACVLAIFALRWLPPPTTSVQMERRFQSWLGHRPYRKRYAFVPLKQIAPALRQAVVAAEDARFYQHHGFDWVEVQKVLDQDLDRGRLGRGASTIDQQLVKNLFLTTSRSFIRKGAEFTLVPLMEALLPKDRILELYLNVIEWGPGVYGAHAASQFWYGLPASQISRDQAIRLAAIVPAPARRKPGQMNDYGAAIDRRMRQMGW